jgi:hypothetical protein
VAIEDGTESYGESAAFTNRLYFKGPQSGMLNTTITPQPTRWPGISDAAYRPSVSRDRLLVALTLRISIVVTTN